MKQPRIADFRCKVTLCRILKTVDSELNRVETVQPVQAVWACVNVRSANVDETTASTRPELQYEIIIRKQDIDCDCVIYNGRIHHLLEPWYEFDNKYIYIKAGEIVGKA